MFNIKLKYLLYSTFLVGFLLIHFPLLISPFDNWNLSFNPQLASNYGDFVSGYIGTFFLLLNILLLLIVHSSQIKSEFDKTFYMLLQIHRDNINNFRYCENRGLNAVDDMISAYDIILDEFINHGDQTISDNELLIISFFVLYYGYSNRATFIINSKDKQLFKHYNSLWSNFIFHTKGICKESRSDNEHILGYNSYIDPFFKHLKNILHIVDRNKTLNDNEKLIYISTLLNLLSIPEKLLFQISLLSIDYDNVNLHNICSKYNFFSGIPDGYLSSIRFMKLIEHFKSNLERFDHGV